MLYQILPNLSDDFGALRLFQFITLRTGGALLTALVISLLLGNKVIAWLRSMQGAGQPIRTDGPEHHIVTKAGTPTMGGVLILLAVTITTLLWADLSNGYVWTVLLVTLGFGALGFADDYLKVARRNSKGLSGRTRILCEIVMALAAAFMIASIAGDPLGTSLALDGLAIGPIIISAMSFGIIAYLAGNAIYADYLQLPLVPGSGELAVLCGSLVGAGLGFLWFNAPPAMVFMGDTGSLSAGAALGATAVVAKHELVLVIIGGLFVLETVSVIVQVVSFKLTGKRVFRMAPIHHHFEKKGWAEPTIVIRFWIIAIVLALVGLATLKLR